MDKKGQIGGQAVIEGVMMRNKKMYAMAVRKPDNDIELVKEQLSPIAEKYKFFGLPLVRGVVSFVDSLIIGMKIITKSAELSGLDDLGSEEEQSKFDKFLNDKFGDKLTDYIIYLSVFIAIIISVSLFMLLPAFISSFANKLLGENTWALGIVEGLVRISIFLGYIFLIAQTKDIKRVFQYHGAEHKTINCYEANEELTVENVAKYTRLNKRCGTSFLIIVMLVSMIVFLFITTKVVWLRFAYRIVLVPVIAGISYEIIRWAGKSESFIVKIISFPGLCLQKVTTLEPDSKQIEVAITALKGALEGEVQ